MSAPVDVSDRAFKPESPRGTTYAVLSVLGVLAVLLFLPSALRLVRLWSTDPGYSHGFIIPIVSFCFIWAYVKNNPLPGTGDARLGGLMLVAGCMVLLLAEVLGWAMIDFFAVVLLLRGLALIVGGREWAGGLWFPILFLFFMFPLPVVWTSYAALWLQEWVSSISTEVLQMFLVCRRQGNAIFLAGLSDPLIVAEQCSGLRQIVAFVALGTLLGRIDNAGPVQWLLLILAAVPVAILANVVRVLMMGFGASIFGVEWINDSWLHHAPALFSLPLGLVLYLLTAQALKHLWQTPTPGGLGGAPPNSSKGDGE
jgi:exosortase